MQKRLAYFLAVLAMATIALAPAKVSAGWGWWGAPGLVSMSDLAMAIRTTAIMGTATDRIGTMAITAIALIDIMAIGTTGTDTGRDTRVADGTDWRSLSKRLPDD